MKIISFNIDIDPLICYYAIHGLDCKSIENDPVYFSGISRFLDLLEKFEIKGTFFITAFGFDEKNTAILSEVVKRGHEIGNHSLSHDYRLTLMSHESIFKEIVENHEFVKAKTGYVCKGFRGPGYNSSADVISALKKMNYNYDSSFFPSLLYYVAKWLIIKHKKLSGHVSKSVIYSFKDSVGGYFPEYIGENVKDILDEGCLVEIPITTLFPPFGIPLIGTSVITFPETLLKILLRFSTARSFINIEAHGIDLCDASESEYFNPLLKIQPDLKYSLERKILRFENVIKFYLSNGYEFKTLSQIAELKKDGFNFKK